jgi:hypothetical protein
MKHRADLLRNGLRERGTWIPLRLKL